MQQVFVWKQTTAQKRLATKSEKDQEANMVSLRSRKNGEEGQVALADFIARIKEEIDTKVLD